MIAMVSGKAPTWIGNWLERHQSPLSRWLHAVGIPLAVAAVVLAAYQLYLWRWDLWWRPVALLMAGYVLQIVGHWHEGNDVGEWILVKRLLGRPYVAVSPRYSLQTEQKMASRTVAVVGASSDRSKYGNKSVRAHLKQGWDVYPVNPKGGEIDGLKVYASLEGIPVKLDRVTLYVSPAAGIALLPAIAKAAPAEFFVNPGAGSAELVERAKELGLDPILACSILDIGATPQEFAD